MTILAYVNMKNVYSHYEQREQIHNRLLELFSSQQIDDFVRLALGISDGRANYSASEHRSGNRVLQSSSSQSIFRLTQELFRCTHAKQIPEIIYRHNIKYLKISIGSEISMMLRPNDFWVANVRTIWAYLLIKHADDYAKANEELALYKDGERESEMDYTIWSEMHRLLETSQARLYDLGVLEVAKQNSKVGKLRYLWADAIANELYNQRDLRKTT